MVSTRSSMVEAFAPVLARRVQLVIVRLLRRSVRMVSRWIVVGGLCAVLGVSACGQRSSSGASGASAVTGVASVATTAVTGSGTVTSSKARPAATGTIRSLGGATPAEQTYPGITPSRGAPQTVFVVRLTSRTRLGARGVLGASYRVGAFGPPKQGCDRVATSIIDRGAAGQRLTVVLRPGPAGWCRGEWRGAVYLEQGPSCAGGPGSAQTRRCPEFASRLVEVGRFGWRVSVTSTVP